MTTYYPINQLPDALYSRLQYIQSTYGVAPDDPPKVDGSAEAGYFASSFGHLHYLTKDSRMYDLYAAHRNHTLSDLDRGYLTSHGVNSPTQAEQHAIVYLFDLYHYLGDENILSLIDDISAGFAGLRDANNWPTTTSNGYTIPTNCLSGTQWGTVNYEADTMTILIYAYYTPNTKCYHNSSVVEMIWNIAKWLGTMQYSNGSWPRDNSTGYVEGYDMIVAQNIAESYTVLDNLGDLTYNSESIKGILKGMHDKHWQFMLDKYGSRTTYFHGSCNASETVLCACIEGYCREWFITGMLRANVWNNYTGYFYKIHSGDERIYPIHVSGLGMFFGHSQEVEDLYKRWS